MEIIKKYGRYIGLLGAIICIIGLFLPFVEVDVSIFTVSKNFIEGDGKIVLGLVVLASVALVFKKEIITVILSVLALLVPIYDLSHVKDEAAGLIDIKLGIGGWLIIIGLIILIIATILTYIGKKTIIGVPKIEQPMQPQMPVTPQPMMQQPMMQQPMMQQPQQPMQPQMPVAPQPNDQSNNQMM